MEEINSLQCGSQLNEQRLSINIGQHRETHFYGVTPLWTGMATIAGEQVFSLN
jgi:hypothetical protein